MIKQDPAHDVDTARFAEKRPHFPREEEEKHAGLHVAFNAECTAIVASDPDGKELADKLEAMGIPLNTVVFDWIPPLDKDDFSPWG
ncbi:MAG: hypothetical protein K2W96_06370 [Gemmataceae bacterium]|nr:hypothetical protein [Gemmataceae bacterium]